MEGTMNTNGNGSFNGRRNSVVEIVQRRQGVRQVQANPMMEVVMTRVGASQRLEILRQLTAIPLAVKPLADLVHADISPVSRDLAVLEWLGLVRWTRVKNSHLYEVTDRVRAVRHGGMIQIALSNGSGQWMLIHQDDSANPRMAVPPPEVFVDSRRLCPTCKQRLSA
jgi:predicted transcriptional regulator